jgi:hypothetical protein
MNTENILIELKCQILDILAVKRMQGMTEVPVSELLEDLGMDAHTNITGLDPNDTIVLTSKTLDNLEGSKAQIRRGATTIQ